MFQIFSEVVFQVSVADFSLDTLLICSCASKEPNTIVVKKTKG